MSQPRHVRDLLSPRAPVTVRADAPIAELRAILVRYSAELVPVVCRDANGRCLRFAGIATRRGLAEYLLGARTTSALARRLERPAASIAVAVEPLRLETTVTEAARALFACGLGALPVVDDAERVVGLLSVDEIVARVPARSAARWRP